MGCDAVVLRAITRCMVDGKAGRNDGRSALTMKSSKHVIS
jgi:hypothetical protein